MHPLKRLSNLPQCPHPLSARVCPWYTVEQAEHFFQRSVSVQGLTWLLSPHSPKKMREKACKKRQGGSEGNGCGGKGQQDDRSPLPASATVPAGRNSLRI